MIKQLIVVSGLPGTGKSTLAEGLARQLNIPVFAKDWLEATLLRADLGSEARSRLGYAGYELLTTLAERQLLMGQSVILDSVASVPRLRILWQELAAGYDARYAVIECVCSDEAEHRRRLETRHRGIPGWHELSWAEVESVSARFPDWDQERLQLDALNPLEANLATALAYLSSYP